MKPARLALWAGVTVWLGLAGAWAGPLVLVENGVPKATVYQYEDPADPPPPPGQKAGRPRPKVRAASDELTNCLARMSGASVEVKVLKTGERPPRNEAVIAVGPLAIDLGLEEPPKTESGDGYRIERKGQTLLLAGETPPSTFFAVCHLLETLGWRWFFDNELGTVVPESKTVTVDALSVTEQPDFISRRMSGANWREERWASHNRLGGLLLPTSHDWARIPKGVGAEHPDYYAMRDGARKPGGWVCTSNPKVAELFAESIVAEMKAGSRAVSISPPDGRGYCQCEACRKLDAPDYLEPTTACTAMSDRYLIFFNDVARRVRAAEPRGLLNFYAYADYTMPPKNAPAAPDNLCVWIAPIRFCRLHGMDNPICRPRQFLRDTVIGGWQSKVSKLGWREYNYNLAELTAPFSKTGVWKHDLAYLHSKGCIGVNIECFAAWHLYGPQTYLAARLMWDAEADADAIMNDFYAKFCGPAAAPVKAYWDRIEKAYRDAPIHCGSFYGLHAIWTPELIRSCAADLDAAGKVANTDLIRRRVEMFRMGLENARYFLAVREAMNAGDFPKAKETYDRWIAHMDAIQATGIHPVAEYQEGYAPRFLAPAILQGAVRMSGDYRKVLLLPDEWSFRYDPRDEGEAAGWGGENVPTGGWQTARTYSATLGEQGIGEQLTKMWYRCDVEVPDVPAGKKLFLYFAELDGIQTKVFVNGKLAGETLAKRRPFDVEATDLIRKGKNTVAVKTDHAAISELGLGGLLRPVMLFAGPAPVPPPPPEKKVRH